MRGTSQRICCGRGVARSLGPSATVLSSSLQAAYESREGIRRRCGWRRRIAELEALNISISSQLSEEKMHKLLSGDQDALSNISLEQYYELTLMKNFSREKGK